MNPTTSYGSWYNVTGTNVTPAGDIGDAITGGDREWRERMEESGALDEIESEWRKAIRAALPDGVDLAGSEFIGPYEDREFPGYPTDEYGSLDLAAIVESVDLMEIVQKHDVDNEVTITAAHVHELLNSQFDQAVLYLTIPDKGDAAKIKVWTEAYVPHDQIISTIGQARDYFLGEAPDEEGTAMYVGELQECLERIVNDRS